MYGIPNLEPTVDVEQIIDRFTASVGNQEWSPEIQATLTQEQLDIRDLLEELARCYALFEFIQERSREQLDVMFGDGAADALVEVVMSGGNEKDLDFTMEQMLLMQEFKNED